MVTMSLNLVESKVKLVVGQRVLSAAVSSAVHMHTNTHKGTHKHSPSSNSSNASLTSWVKKVRETTIVFCALYLKIHWVRGRSSYASTACKNGRGVCIVSECVCKESLNGKHNEGLKLIYRHKAD